jgi:exodeoxyribonuclease III
LLRVVVTFNANGLRSAARKGFFPRFARRRADVLCVEELKAHDVEIATKAFHARGFHRVRVHAEKPGYSGVAIYSRIEPAAVVRFSDHAPLTIDYDWPLT